MNSSEPPRAVHAAQAGAERPRPACVARASWSLQLLLGTMRVGTYNVLGLSGYCPSYLHQINFGEPGSQQNITHFASVFEQLDCDVLGIEEGVPHIHMQAIADALGC